MSVRTPVARTWQKIMNCYHRTTLDMKAEHHGKFVVGDLWFLSCPDHISGGGLLVNC